MTVIDKPKLDRAHVLALLNDMIRIRKFEDKCAELYTQQKIRGFLHLYDGEEAIAAGVIPVLDERDRIVATYREHGHALVRGVPMTTVMARSMKIRMPMKIRKASIDLTSQAGHICRIVTLAPDWQVGGHPPAWGSGSGFAPRKCVSFRVTRRQKPSIRTSSERLPFAA